MPNALAYLVIFAWPLVVVVLFWKLPLPKALVASILGGYLLLPTGVAIDLPVLPPFDKTLMPSLTAAIMCFLLARRPAALRAAPGRASPAAAPPEPATEMVRTTRGRWLFRMLFVVLFLTPALTAYQNADPVLAGPLIIPGLRPYDIGSMMLELAVAFLPFFLAQRFLARPEDQVMLLRAFVIAGLGYSVLCLYEVRMSPQLNNMIYGFFPHSFLQHIRAGGFRPIVFLQHGLWVGIFLAMSILAAATLFRWSQRTGKEGLSSFAWAATAIWLILVLFLSKAVGAFVLVLAFLPLVLLAGVQGQLLFAMIVAGITLFYPLLRGAGWIPIDTVYEVSLSFSEERAESLKFRLDNEDVLLERAAEKPIAGWGSWGRNLIYDPYSGKMTSVTDGAWIIIIGTFGWIGYIAHFGLLTAPVLLLGRARRRLGLTVETSGLAMVLAINLMDLIPNATLTPLTYLVAGALCGRYGLAYGSAPQTAAKAAATAGRAPKPGRAAWPTAPGATGAGGRSASAQDGTPVRAPAPETPGMPAMAADRRKYRQPRRRPE